GGPARLPGGAQRPQRRGPAGPAEPAVAPARARRAGRSHVAALAHRHGRVLGPVLVGGDRADVAGLLEVREAHVLRAGVAELAQPREQLVVAQPLLLERVVRHLAVPHERPRRAPRTSRRTRRERAHRRASPTCAASTVAMNTSAFALPSRSTVV